MINIDLISLKLILLTYAKYRQMFKFITVIIAVYSYVRPFQANRFDICGVINNSQTARY